MINSNFYVLLRSTHVYESMRDSIHKGQNRVADSSAMFCLGPCGLQFQMTEWDPGKEKQGRPGVSEHLGDGKGQ